VARAPPPAKGCLLSPQCAWDSATRTGAPAPHG